VVDPELSDGPTIAELVQQCVDSGLNTRELARRTGGRVSHQRFDDLLHERVVGFPKSADMIEAQAAALGVTTQALLLAYARQLGVDLPRDQPLLAAILPASAKALTVRQARLVVDLIDQMAPSRPVAALDLNDFGLEELREVTRFWQELANRRGAVGPALEAVLSHVMDTIDTAIAAATRES
jgi:hypothetical protein